MTGEEYQKHAMRTASHLLDEELILNGVLGLNGEAGEVSDALKKWKFQGHEFDMEHIAYELGDCLWYIAIMAKGIGKSLDEIMDMNVHKLMVRYPDGFDKKRSINREG